MYKNKLSYEKDREHLLRISALLKPFVKNIKINEECILEFIYKNKKIHVSIVHFEFVNKKYGFFYIWLKEKNCTISNDIELSRIYDKTYILKKLNILIGGSKTNIYDIQ